MSKEAQRRSGFCYLIIAYCIWLSYTVLAVIIGQNNPGEGKIEEQITFVTFLGQFTLALWLLPSLFRLGCRAKRGEPLTAKQMKVYYDSFRAAAYLAFLLLACNYTYNAGYLLGNVTTSNQLVTTIPMFVYGISMFYTIAGQDRMQIRPVKVFCLLVGLAGVLSIMVCDGKEST